MLALAVCVVVGIAIVLAAVVAPRLRVSPQIVLIVEGAIIGLVPAFSDVELPSEAVLLLFLPVILFAESITTSPREMRRYLRVIVLNGTLLVVVTAFAIAWAAAAMGLPWPLAFILGAALAPTDATAVANLDHGIPPRNLAIMRGESLINDGTALVLYALAVAVAADHVEFTPLAITWMLVVSYVGGVAIGIAIGVAGYWARRAIAPPLPNVVATLLIPLVAFLVAELVGASGVLAVVVAGILTSQLGPRLRQPEARENAMTMWRVGGFVLNGALFVLIGVELPAIVRAMPADAIGFGLLLGLVAWAAVLASRFVFTELATTVIRSLDRRPIQRELRAPLRYRVVGLVAGFRGGVSLAAALGVPAAVATVSDVPGRDLIVFVTAVVILLTLVVQGLALPLFVRLARYPADDGLEGELRDARVTASEAALDALPQVASELGVEPTIVAKVRTESERHLAQLRSEGADDDESVERVQRHDAYARLKLALIDRKRDVVLRMRDERRIDDAVLRRIQSDLDLEELRLGGRAVE